MTQPTQTPVIPFTDVVSDNAKPITVNNSTSLLKKPFNKPPKWSFVILKFLIVVLIPLILNSPDIHIKFYMINIMF